jgi:hypothetical protein
MKQYFAAIGIVLILTGCGAGSNLNIVSPSASDEEVKKRANEVLKEKGPSAPKEKPSAPPASPAGSTPEEKPSAPPASPAGSTESVPAREMETPRESSMEGGCAHDALINLLEKKGIITKSELMEEMKKLQQGSK